MNGNEKAGGGHGLLFLSPSLSPTAIFWGCGIPSVKGGHAIAWAVSLSLFVCPALCFFLFPLAILTLAIIILEDDYLKMQSGWRWCEGGWEGSGRKRKRNWCGRGWAPNDKEEGGRGVPPFSRKCNRMIIFEYWKGSEWEGVFVAGIGHIEKCLTLECVMSLSHLTNIWINHSKGWAVAMLSFYLGSGVPHWGFKVLNDDEGGESKWEVGQREDVML